MRALVDKGCEHVRFTRLSKLRVISDLIKARWADHANVQKRAAESLYAGRTVKRLRFIVSSRGPKHIRFTHLAAFQRALQL